jgi:hypothetical protein
MGKSIPEQIEQLLSLDEIAMTQASYWVKALDNLLVQTEAATSGESPIFKENFVDVINRINDNKDEYIKKLPVLLSALSTALVQLQRENNRQMIALIQDLIKEKTG